MDLVIKEAGSEIRGRARAYTPFLIVGAHIKGCSIMTSLMDKAN
jgi:hypothetical protein